MNLIVGNPRNSRWHRRLHEFLIAAVLLVLGALADQILTVAFRPSTPSAAAVEQLVQDEAAFLMADRPDLQKYADLFVKDAIVIDFGVAQVWKGQSEILRRAGPLHFDSLTHMPIAPVSFDQDGQGALLRTRTTFVQTQPSRLIGSGLETWRFRKIDGVWKISSFEFDE
jgi:hypothetical protein